MRAFLSSVLIAACLAGPVQAADNFEERFYNVRIDTNGAVGSVYFDFDFLQDGKVTNRGSETWQMVRGEDGWNIGAMLYSMGK